MEQNIWQAHCGFTVDNNTFATELSIDSEFASAISYCFRYYFHSVSSSSSFCSSCGFTMLFFAQCICLILLAFEHAHIHFRAHTLKQQENDASMYCTRFMLSFLLFWPYKCEHTHTDTYTLTGEWDHTVKAFAFFWLFHFDSNYIVVPVLVALSQQFLAGAYVSVFVFASVCVCTWC